MDTILAKRFVSFVTRTLLVKLLPKDYLNSQLKSFLCLLPKLLLLYQKFISGKVLVSSIENRITLFWCFIFT